MFNYKEYLPDFTTEEEIKDSLVKRICKYLNTPYAFLVTNGTDAIEISLRALKLPRGSHVIVPDLSYIASATAVANCGCVPVYCDITEDYFGLSFNSLQRNCSEKVRAVIVVHFAGYVHRDIFRIAEFCKERNIFLIEDCAQAFPCSIDGQKVGTIGDLGTCSFQSSKIINSGEGGLIITNSSETARFIEIISDWGMHKGMIERDFSVASSNYRMSAIQAYFLIKQIEKIDEIIEDRITYINKLEEYCTNNDIKISCPQKLPNIRDCPFFLPIRCDTKYKMVEPRREYPMRDSILVKSIIAQWYPDLYNEYIEINSNSDPEKICYKVIQENDFINISNHLHIPFKDIVKPYIESKKNKKID